MIGNPTAEIEVQAADSVDINLGAYTQGHTWIVYAGKMRSGGTGPWAGFVVAWDDMACVVITRRIMYIMTEGF